MHSNSTLFCIISARSALATTESVSNESNLCDIWSSFSNSSTVPDAASSHAQIGDCSGDGAAAIEGGDMRAGDIPKALLRAGGDTFCIALKNRSGIADIEDMIIPNVSFNMLLRVCWQSSTIKLSLLAMVRYVRDTLLHKILEWLEKHVRLPLEGTAFDNYVATPLKTKYLGYTQMQRLD